MLGCTVCAAFAAAAPAADQAGPKARNRTKFARYEVSRLCEKQASGAIDNHAASEEHRQALAFANRTPEHCQLLSAKETRAEAEDRALLRGRVPQARDWQDAWADCTTSMSFNKQEQIAAKKRKRCQMITSARVACASAGPNK